MNRVIRTSILSIFAVVVAAQFSAADTLGDQSRIYDQKIETTTVPPLAEGTAHKYRIRSINIKGADNISHEVLKASSGLVVGDSIYIPGSVISGVITKLWNQRYFSDIQSEAVIDGEEADIELIFKERPRVMRWDIKGVTNSKRKELLEKLKLRRGSELSDYVIDKNKKVIRDFFVEKGYRNVEVEAAIKSDSVIKMGVNVDFEVKLNPKVRVGEITFEGNDAITDARLRGTFKKTHKVGINFFNNTKLRDADYEADKELLIDYYNSKGYRNARIISDSIYDINPKRIGIKITLDEGNKYYIRSVNWVGNSVHSTEQLQQIFGVKQGDVYDKKSINKRLGYGKEDNPEEISVQSLYQNEGYLMSQIDPSESVVGRDSIDLNIKIFEGKQFTINNVAVSGNMRVDDEVIRRELYTRPGELYNRALIMQTLRTLGSMGHFNQESIRPNINLVPNSTNLVDVGWDLEEQASDQFNIAGGWGAGTFVGSIGVTLNNLSLRNFFKKGAWRPYPMGQNQRLSISGQTNGTYYKALSFSFTDPWLGGRKPNSFTVGFHISEQNNAYYAWQKGTEFFRTLGVTAGLGKRLSWPDPYFSFYGELSYQRYDLKNWSSFLMRNGDANLLSLRLVLGRSSVVDPIYPRQGTDFSLSVQLTPPYSLWDGVNYADTNLSEQTRYKFVEFHKWNFKAQWFQPLSSNGNLVLMLRAEMGYLGHYNKYKISPFERFQVGGDGLTGYSMYGVDIISLRGYSDGSLDPVGSEYSVAYNKYTVELRYPVLMKPSARIFVLGFAEGGNGFSSWSTFSPFKIKRSAGVGVRVYLPIVGMIGVDWGWGFDPAAGKTKPHGSQIHFVLGQQF